MTFLSRARIVDGPPTIGALLLRGVGALPRGVKATSCALQSRCVHCCKIVSDPVQERPPPPPIFLTSLCLSASYAVRMGKILKSGKVVIVLRGRYAGRKAVVVKAFDEGTKERKFGHCTLVSFSAVKHPGRRALVMRLYCDVPPQRLRTSGTSPASVLRSHHLCILAL